jgi:hypothetical protein
VDPGPDATGGLPRQGPDRGQFQALRFQQVKATGGDRSSGNETVEEIEA